LNVDWIQLIDRTMKHIETADVKDPKLALIFSIQRLLSVVNSSVNGWNKWVMTGILDELKEDEIQEIYDSMKTFTLQFLELDKKWTKKVDKKMKKIKEKKIPPRPNIIYDG